MNVEITTKEPICGLCGKKYDAIASVEQAFNVENHWWGMRLFTNKTRLFSKKKQLVTIELCDSCHNGVLLIRKGLKFDYKGPITKKTRK